MTKEIEYIMHAPVHSDFLIYWTGRDIMKRHGSLSPNERNYSSEVVGEFISRLESILKYGLWMRKHEGTDHIKVNGKEFPKPNVARLCFTELKLSDSLLHAHKFGPLGIGFKRFFVINRLGSPVYYVPDTQGTGVYPFFPPYSDWYNSDAPDELFSFFKNMSQTRNDQGYIKYDLYEESEWRIIYSDRIKNKMSPRKQKYFIDPKDSNSGEYHQFYQAIASFEKPDYLVPVDEWLALIIYPNLQIKNMAMESSTIRTLLNNLKNKQAHVIGEGLPPNERTNFPIEMSIGSITHF